MTYRARTKERRARHLGRVRTDLRRARAPGRGPRSRTPASGGCATSPAGRVPPRQPDDPAVAQAHAGADRDLLAEEAAEVDHRRRDAAAAVDRRRVAANGHGHAADA